MRTEKTLIDVLSVVERNPEQGLTDLRIMAERWGLPEIAEWAHKECAGYGGKDSLPSYRVWEARLVGDLSGGLGEGVLRDADLREVVRSSPQASRLATTYRCIQPVGWLWSEGYGQKEGREVQRPVVRELEDLVTAEIAASGGGGLTCVKAEHRFGTTEYGRAAQSARQWAIDLCLGCEKKGLVLPNPRNEEMKAKDHKGEAEIVRKIWEELVEHKWEAASIAATIVGMMG